MQLTIVPFYAALLALFFIYLSIRVILTRRKEKVSLGDGQRIPLQRAIRAHGNFAEYLPFSLVMLSFVELKGYASELIHLLCLVLLVGRAIHAYAVSQEPEEIKYRVAGMFATFSVLGISALLVIFA